MAKRTWRNLPYWIAQQRQWIQEHGGNLAAYVARYGSANDPNRYGQGGEAIYAADVAHLVYLMMEQKAGRG